MEKVNPLKKIFMETKNKIIKKEKNQKKLWEKIKESNKSIKKKKIA